MWGQNWRRREQGHGKTYEGQAYSLSDREMDGNIILLHPLFSSNSPSTWFEPIQVPGPTTQAWACHQPPRTQSERSLGPCLCPSRIDSRSIPGPQQGMDHRCLSGIGLGGWGGGREQGFVMLKASPSQMAVTIG